MGEGFTKGSIRSEIIDIISENVDVPVAEIKPDSHLVNDLGVESMTFLTIIIGIEDRFDITIDDDQHGELTTVNAITDFVAGQLGV